MKKLIGEPEKELDKFGEEIVKERRPEEELTSHVKRKETIAALNKKGIEYFFPIQYETYQTIYSGQDLIGRDRTGSGKTMAYTLPVLERFRDKNLFGQHKLAKFLIILPTRELCIQVHKEIQSLRVYEEEFISVAVYGGASMRDQTDQIRRRVDIIVATPGRLIDLLDKGKIKLDYLEAICLDEADEMLKMGFQKDVEKVYYYIRNSIEPKYLPQNLLFSATVPKWVEQISRQYMRKDKTLIDLIKNQAVKTSKTVSHCSMCMKLSEIIRLMRQIVDIYCGKHGRCIIFCEKKSDVSDIISMGKINIESEALHGDIPQEQRERTFKKFKDGKLKCLISTNVAARGLDIPDVDLVIQLEPPKNVDDYIHRSGRTGRAGRKGICLTIYLKSEQYLLRNIERVAQIKFKDIGPPQVDDLLTRKAMDIVEDLKNIDENVLDYFEEIASDFAYEQGGDRALMRALAALTGVKKRLAVQSVMGNVDGYITFKFKSASDEAVTEKELLQYLRQKLGLVENDSVLGVVQNQIKTVTKFCLAFNFPELFLKKMEAVEAACEKKDSKEPYLISRVTALSQLQLEVRAKEELPQYSQEEYDEAMYHKWELYIGRLDSGTDGEELQKFFIRKGVRSVNLSLKEKNKQGFGFLLCLTKEDLDRAVQLDGAMFEGRNLELRAARSR